MAEIQHAHKKIFFSPLYSPYSPLCVSEQHMARHPSLLTPLITVLVMMVVLSGASRGSASSPPREVRLTIVDWLTDINLLDERGVAVPFEKRASQAISANFFIAVRHFNERNTSFLPALDKVRDCPTQLRIVNFCDDSGNQRRGVKIVKELGEETDVFVANGAISTLYEAEVAQVVFGTPFVVQTATPDDDVGNYRLLSTTQLGIGDYVGRLADVISFLGYTNIACIYMNYDLVPAYEEALEAELKGRGMALYAYPYMFHKLDTINLALKKIKETDLNVIVYIGFSNDLRDTLADLATAHGLNSDDNLWIFTRYDALPTPEEMGMNANLSQLMRGSIALVEGLETPSLFASYLDRWGEFDALLPFINSYTLPHFRNATNDNATSSCPSSSFSQGDPDQRFYGGCRWDELDYVFPPQFFTSSLPEPTVSFHGHLWARIYDVVMAVGLGACGLSQNGSENASGRIDGTRLYASMMNLNFTGLSGQIRFSGGGEKGNGVDRELVSLQIQNWKFDDNQPFSVPHMVVVGHFAGVGQANMNIREPLQFKSASPLTGVPYEITPPLVDESRLPAGLIYLGYAEIVLIHAIAVGTGAWLFSRRSTRHVSRSQPQFLCMMLLGCCLSSWSILMFTVSDFDNREVADPATACNASVLLACLGMQIALFALIGKTVRAKAVFAHRSTALTRAARPDSNVTRPEPTAERFPSPNTPIVKKRLEGGGGSSMMPPLTLNLFNAQLLSHVFALLALVALAQLGLLFVLYFGVPLVWRRRTIEFDRHNLPLASMGACALDPNYNGGTIALLVLISFSYVGTMAVAYVVSRGTENHPIEFGERRYVALALSSLFQMFVMGVPILAAAYQSPTGRFVVTSCVVLFSIMLFLGFNFWPIVTYVRRRYRDAESEGGYYYDDEENENKGEKMTERRTPPPAAGTGQTPEMDVESGMRISICARRFERFCEENYIVENFHFIKEIMELRDSCSGLSQTGSTGSTHSSSSSEHLTLESRYLLLERVKAVMEIYIRENSLLQVNISHEIRTKVEENYAEFVGYWRNPSSSLATKNNTSSTNNNVSPSPDENLAAASPTPPSLPMRLADAHLIFAPAYDEIVLITNFGGWSRFVQGGGIYGLVKNPRPPPARTLSSLSPVRLGVRASSTRASSTLTLTREPLDLDGGESAAGDEMQVV